MTLQLTLFLFISFFVAPVFAKSPVVITQNALLIGQNLSASLAFASERHCAVSKNELLNERYILENCLSKQADRQNTINLGFTDESYWFTAEFENESELDKFYLEMSYGLLDNISFWLVNQRTQEVQYYETGDKFVFDQRPFENPHFVFPVEMQKGNQYSLFIHVTTSSSLQFNLVAWHPQSFAEQVQHRYALIGGLLGILLIMVIYNLAIYFIVKDQSYLFFSVCLAGYCGLASVLIGIGYAYFWPKAVYWNDFALIFFCNLCFFGLAQFSRHFLLLDENAPRSSRILNYLSVACLILVLLSPFLPYQPLIKLTSITAVMVPIISYIAGIRQWYRGFSTGKLFIIAFTAFALSITLFVLNKAGIIERSLMTEFSVHLGSVITLGLLSIAVASRMRRERHDKETAQNQALEALDRFRSLFENSLDGIFRSNINGQVVAANASFARIMAGSDASKRVMTQRNLQEFFPDAERNFDQAKQQLVQDGFVINYEMPGKRLSGEEFWSSLSARIFVDVDTHESYIEGSIVDITQRKQSEAQLNYLASHDPLTGLLNRNAFEHKLQNALDLAHSKKAEHALLYIDLDRFKIVNDTCGHGAGDELLKHLSHLLNRHISQHDALARLGGDEFASLMFNSDTRWAVDIAYAIQNDINGYKFIWEGRSFSVGCSIGVVPINHLSGNLKEVLSLADQACYTAKEQGRNRVIAQDEHESVLNTRLNEALMITSINESLEKNHFELYFQPMRTLQESSSKLCYEILLRLRKDGTLLNPGSFMPAAERYNVMASIDRWVIRAYFQWLAEHPQSLKNLEMVSINLSGQTLAEAGLLEELKLLINTYGIPGNKICFEITESVALSGLQDTIVFINSLKELGIRFALDDFGSGYSTYTYLTQLPVDFVKIDGSFVKSILMNPVNEAIVRSIVDVAHVMKLGVIAEFVESAAVENKLKELNIDLAQGYYCGTPLPLSLLLTLEVD